MAAALKQINIDEHISLGLGLPAAAAESVAENAASSVDDVELTSLPNVARGTNIRRSQRQQLACQHEVIIRVICIYIFIYYMPAIEHRNLQ